MSFYDFRECLARCAHAQLNGRRPPILARVLTSPVVPLPKAFEQFVVRIFAEAAA